MPTDPNRAPSQKRQNIIAPRPHTSAPPPLRQNLQQPALLKRFKIRFTDQPGLRIRGKRPQIKHVQPIDPISRLLIRNLDNLLPRVALVADGELFEHGAVFGSGEAGDGDVQAQGAGVAVEEGYREGPGEGDGEVEAEGEGGAEGGVGGYCVRGGGRGGVGEEGEVPGEWDGGGGHCEWWWCELV